MGRTSLRRAFAATAAALVLALGANACGGDDENTIDGPSAVELTRAFERLDDALDTEETIRSSPAEAKRLQGRVRRIVSDGSFENERLDEFGLASLGRLEKAVPSLVEVDRNGVVRALDRSGTRAFLDYAIRDSKRATHGPAAREVATIERVVRDADPRRGTVIDQPDSKESDRPTIGGLLARADADTRDIWPDLATRLRRVRGSLAP